ncbi:flippase-like domain-containing protein [candidate division KSB1 bacterium]|nr:flippase-like domain-containing protein [candidate division KSB1 bacterium]
MFYRGILLAKKITIPVLKIIVSIGLIFFLFYKLGFKNVTSQFTAINIYWFLLGIILFTLSNFLGSVQWSFLLKAVGIHLPLLRVISYYYTGLFFNNFLVGYIGGDAIRVYDITKASGSNSEAISAVFFDRLIGFAVLTILALLASLYLLKTFIPSNVIMIILTIFLFWVMLIVILFNKRFLDKISWLFKWMLPETLSDKIRKIYLGINQFKNHKTILVKVFATSIIIQTLRILVHYAAARSIGVNIAPIYFIIFIPIIALLASLPISIGGIGIRESSGVALFSQIWSIQADIVAFEFFAFLIGIISTIPGGIIFMLRKEITKPLTKGELVK